MRCKVGSDNLSTYFFTASNTDWAVMQGLCFPLAAVPLVSSALKGGVEGDNWRKKSSESRTIINTRNLSIR